MKLTIDLNVNVKQVQESELLKILKELKILNLQIMAKQEQFDAVLTRIDAATNKIADQLRALKDQIANQGLPGDVEDAVLARLETAATQLEAVGASPENPVPDVPDTPVQ